MPSLNAAQKQQVAAWVNEGLSLSDVQKRIAADLGVSMTYMDVRFLVDDLDLTLVDKTPPRPPPRLPPKPRQAPRATCPGMSWNPRPSQKASRPKRPQAAGR